MCASYTRCYCIIQNVVTMKDNEKAENNVDAKVIIAEVLAAVGLNAPTFAGKLGINYQRIFDLQRGRTKKFNPGIVNLICQKFPQINKTYLYTGEGPVLLPQEDLPAQHERVDMNGMIAMSQQVIDLFQQTVARVQELQDKAAELAERERLLWQKEIELVKREAEVEKREIALGIKKES